MSTYLPKTSRRKGFTKPKFPMGGGIKKGPAIGGVGAIPKPKVMKPKNMPGYFGDGHAF